MRWWCFGARYQTSLSEVLWSVLAAEGDLHNVRQVVLTFLTCVPAMVTLCVSDVTGYFWSSFLSQHKDLQVSWWLAVWMWDWMFDCLSLLVLWLTGDSSKYSHLSHSTSWDQTNPRPRDSEQNKWDSFLLENQHTTFCLPWGASHTKPGLTEFLHHCPHPHWH